MNRTRKPALGVVAATTLAAASVLLGPGTAAAAEPADRSGSTPCTEINFEYFHADGGTLVTSHCAYGAWVSVDTQWGPGTGENVCAWFEPSVGDLDSDSKFFIGTGEPFICR